MYISGLIRRNAPEQFMLSPSAAALMPVFAITLLHYWSVIPQMQGLSFIGYIGFSFCNPWFFLIKSLLNLKKPGGRQSRD